MSNISNNSGDTGQKLPQLMVNTADFNNQDLQDFVDISEEIIRTTRERRSQGKGSKSRSNTIAATKTREGLFESISIDDDQFLQAMEHETTYDAVKDRADIIRSIENLMKYFEEDVKVKEESFFKSSCAKKSSRGKVATAVASLRSKCGLTAASPLVKRKSPAKVMKTNNIEELRKKYENSIEAETLASATTKDKDLKRKTKVKQLALLFSNLNSKIRTAPPTSQTCEPGKGSNCGDTLTSATFMPKSPKIKPKFSTYKTKLPSPKPSPCLKRKSLRKTSSSNSLADTSSVYNGQSSANYLGAENIFCQLPVKDMILLYNKFIKDMSQQDPKFSKHAEVVESNVKKAMQKGEVVIEKQTSVKELRDNLEAKLSPNKSLSNTLPRLKKSALKSPLDKTSKSEGYKDISQISGVENDSQDMSISPGAKKCLAQSKKKDVTFSENVTNLEPSLKRTQSMIRSSYCVEPLAPPKKIRRFHQERLAPKMVFQNPHLERLFYHWLKDNNGVAFDIIAADKKTNTIEIVPKNSSDQVLPPHEVQEILEAAVSQLESSTNETFDAVEENKHNGIVIIKQTLENEENCLEKSIIEIELPVEDEQQDARTITIEGSDSGLNSTNKATSEDSQTDLKSLELSSSNAKPSRKKKLRRNFPMKDEISVTAKPKVSSTESDSDDRNKTKNIKVQSCTLPRTMKPFNTGKEMVLNPTKSCKAEKLQAADQLNYKSNISPLDNSLIRQVNLPSRIKAGFTLTVLSSPAAQPKNDCCEAKQARANVKGVSRSCPSLLETDLDSDIAMLQDKSASEELTDCISPKMLQEQQNLLMASFIKQGFNMTLNEVHSPLSINIKTKCNANKSTHNAENFIISYKVNAQQQTSTNRPGVEQFSAISSTQQQAENITPKAERNSTPSSSNTSSCSSQTSIQNHCNFNPNDTQKKDMSQFWISSGDLTAAVTIHYCEPGRLMLLKNIYNQKSLEANEMGFGIDDQRFYLDSSMSSSEVIKQVPKKDNYSQYWFATGDVLIPFKGPQMTTEKIRKFFNYIREFMEETETLRFGIDSYEFSNICQQTGKSVASINCSSWVANLSSPLKTSDLDQSDLDSEEYRQSVSIEEVWRKFDEFTLVERDQPTKCKIFQERALYCKNSLPASDTNESVRNIMIAAENVGRARAKTTAL